MEVLRIEDFDSPPELREITLLGKQVFVRELCFDDQAKIARFKGGDDATATKLLLVLCLCNKDGSRLFADLKVGMKAVGKISVREIISAVEAASDHNGMGDEVKN